MSEYSVRHVAIIPDGNRRWARARGEQPWRGHRAGFTSFEDILKKALDLNVFCLSFWGMSTDNMKKRDPREVRELFTIFKEMIEKSLKSDDLKKHDVRISIIGEWRERFPRALVKLFEKAITATADRKKHIVNLLICYDGKSEMTRAVEQARHTAAPITSMKDFLLTRDLPSVDLVIRTGGDPHLSAGFMMWDVADAQLSFSPKLWPDFTPGDFTEALNEFLVRERRFGA